MKLTDLDAADYVASLALTEQPRIVRKLDGALLVRIADDHFVMWHCKVEHDDDLPPHRGPQLLRRVMPPDWAVFFSVANPAEEFEFHHWGPVED